VVPKLGGALCGPKAGRSVVWSQSWEEPGNKAILKLILCGTLVYQLVAMATVCLFFAPFEMCAWMG